MCLDTGVAHKKRCLKVWQKDSLPLAAKSLIDVNSGNSVSKQTLLLSS